MSVVTGGIFLIFYLIYCYVEKLLLYLFRVFIPKREKDISGKVVLVTGAGHGIGRELALQLSERGARVILWDINKRNNEAVADLIKENQGYAKAYTVDVTDVNNVKLTAQQVRRDVGHVDILINNAGVLNGGSVFQMREEDIRRLFDINVLAHFWTVREFLPYMIERNDGHVIGIASMAGRNAVAFLTDYSASKFAVAGFMESLRDEMRREGHKGLQFTTVYPLFVDTGMSKYIRGRLTPAMNTSWVASVIIDGFCKNKKDIYIPSVHEPIFRLRWLAPQKILDKAMETCDFGINPQYE